TWRRRPLRPWRRHLHGARQFAQRGRRGGGTGAVSAAPDTTPAVAARGLRKTYGALEAVAGVDVTVRAGDVYGYLGPNGAGKTTSLRMMLGLIQPTAGEVRLFGRDPVLDPVSALDGVAGFVEDPAFYPYLSGRANLELLADLDGGGNGASASALPPRCCGGRGCSCSTSRPPGSTRAGCATCARSSADWPARASPCSSRAT